MNTDNSSTQHSSVKKRSHANDHILTGDDGHKPLLHDAGHDEQFTKWLHEEVQWIGWFVSIFDWMSNPTRVMVQTPEFNFAREMVVIRQLSKC